MNRIVNVLHCVRVVFHLLIKKSAAEGEVWLISLADGFAHIG